VELLAERVARLVGADPVAWQERAAPWQREGAVEGGNERFSVLLADRRRVFVKAARGELTAAWLRREHEVYAHLRGTFMPKLEAFDDDPRYPVLVLEDLSEADWGTRWDPVRVASVRSALAELAASDPPPNTRPVQQAFPHLFGQWQAVKDDPEPFLSTGIRSPKATTSSTWMCAVTTSVCARGPRFSSIGIGARPATLISTWQPGYRASRTKAAPSRGKYCRQQETMPLFSQASGRQWSDSHPRQPPPPSGRGSAARLRPHWRGANTNSASRRRLGERPLSPESPHAGL
jgi:hypothetical protein